ncbi:MAG: hypothetical protein JSW11_20670 [Candidatus Heimdallarchaeota archaeon]|nr:MAG: hypothetical protein JSW11_20670 [Candidatus Heimdallarchaeota archaeon]
MRLRRTFVILYLLVLFGGLGLLAISVQTIEKDFSLPTEGTKTFTLDLKKDWYYHFEVRAWSGDETINISILQGKEVIFSAFLIGEDLEYEMDPDPPYVYYPALGDSFQVEESGDYTLVAQVIVEPTQDSARLKLYCTNQRVLGFDTGFLVIPWIIIVICGFFALIGSFFFDLFQAFRGEREWPMRFSYETKKSPNQTKIVISSPINKSYVPRIISPIIVIAFFLFFITELIRFFQQNFTLTISLGISVVGVIFTPLVSMLLLSRFVIVAENDKIQVGRQFWKLNRFKTISKYQITDIHWDIREYEPEYYLFLIIETSDQKHQFQPLGITIPHPQPRAELQQFLDAFLQELNEVLMK